MKKILFFLITILIVINITKVNAANNFYEAEYIDNIYTNKVKNNTIYYEQARLFREKITNTPVYCTEPFATFNTNSNYQQTENNKLTEHQKERISLLTYYGYNYPGHTDKKWYAITQFLIWKTAEPNAEYYFTDKLNGNKINKFESEINEIETLINNHNIKPSIENKLFRVIYGYNLVIPDQNKVLNNYQVTSQNANIENNMLIVDKLEPGTHKITLEKKQIYNNNQKNYISENSQDLISLGNITPIIIHVDVEVQNSKLIINKIDSITKTTSSSGEGNIKGTILGIYNIFDTLIQEIVIEEENNIIEGLNYGRYYIKEITPGKGYKINNNKYPFTISEDNIFNEITIENKIIEKEIIVKKLYGSNNNFIPEQNISFNIYNSSDKFITTITTNKDGIATTTLPYGTYTIKQLTTTEGYQKVKPIQIIVNNEDTETITLKNYKINVPDTSTNNLYRIIKKIWKKLKYYLFY